MLVSFALVDVRDSSIGGTGEEMMSKPKFTQGEWEIEDATERGEFTMTIESKVGDSFAPVATVFGIEDFPCVDAESHNLENIQAEMFANANLIAAAPKMYLALTEAYQFLGKPETHPQDDSGLFELSCLLRDILANARGASKGGDE